MENEIDFVDWMELMEKRAEEGCPFAKRELERIGKVFNEAFEKWQKEQKDGR